MCSVHCCTLSGVLDIRNGFPSKDPVPCGVAAGVVAIVAPAIQLNGSLASGVWSAFSTTLQVLDMAGGCRAETGERCSLHTLPLACSDAPGGPALPVSLPALPCTLAWLPRASNLLTLHLCPAVGTEAPRAAENNLTGTIPDDLMDLRALTYLRLERNKLSGPIPATLAAMSGLVVIRLVSPSGALLAPEK